MQSLATHHCGRANEWRLHASPDLLNATYTSQLELFRMMAANEVIGLNLPQDRRFFPTYLGRIAAPRMEVTTTRRVRRIGHIPLEQRPLRTQPRIGLRHR